MSKQSLARGCALLVAGATVLVATGSAQASAPDVASASATAVKITALTQPIATGAYSVTSDGTSVVKNGTVIPRFAGGGLVHQDAAIDAAGSHACAGLAAVGADTVRSGGLSCLVPGRPLSLDLGALDLGRLSPDALLAGVPAPLRALVAPGASSALAGTTAPRLVLEAGLLQATCNAANGVGTASAQLADARIAVVVPGQAPVTILDLPSAPAPNTSLTGSLTQVTRVLGDTLRGTLSTSLGGLLARLVPPQQQSVVLDSILAQLDGLLQPIADQVLSVRLNEQHGAGTSSVDTSALSLRVLPSGSGVGIQPVQVQVGQVACFAQPTQSARSAARSTSPVDEVARVAAPVSAPVSVLGAVLAGTMA